jgi:hypothetical protein
MTRLVIFIDAHETLIEGRSAFVPHVGRVLVDTVGEPVEVAVCFLGDVYQARAALAPMRSITMSEGEIEDVSTDFAIAERDEWVGTLFEQLAADRLEQLGEDPAPPRPATHAGRKFRDLVNDTMTPEQQAAARAETDRIIAEFPTVDPDLAPLIGPPSGVVEIRLKQARAALAGRLRVYGQGAHVRYDVPSTPQRPYTEPNI